MTVHEYKQSANKQSKYRNKKVVVPGIGTFDSTKEYNHFCELRALERLGVITGLKRQVRYEILGLQDTLEGKVLEKPVYYIADFVYERNGETVVEDVKGYKKGAAYSLFAIKRKLMLNMHGIRVVEV